ncbi:MAG TPA: HAD-IIB family hydrolase [Patescibacteria group bacterium]|nr:HAD-IIB family hydrolase [Patescibacteria group bacterium]
MDYEYVIRKLQRQENPEILFSDIDGTLFSPNLNLLTAPLYNVQTASYLKEKSISFITVTGRSFWRRIDQYHLSLLGMPKADAVITANGTAIYYLQRDKYISDFIWQGLMQSTKITDSSGKVFSWNKLDITNAIADYLEKNRFPNQFGKGNTYLIRIRFNKYPVEKIQQIRKDILAMFPKGLRVLLTEKLLWQNSLSIFSGEMLITPITAGKDKAVQYLLKNFSSQIHKPIHALIFGDATIDIPMLTMKGNETYETLSQYGVRPTPLAREFLEEKMITNNNIKILGDDGPREILWTLRPELRKIQTQNVILANEVRPESKERSWTSQDPEKLSFSPAQNNKARKIIRVFERVLDKIVDKNMSPNEISFLGLQKLSEGLKNLQQPKASITQKAKGLYFYGFGNLADILDGIRARNSNMKEENGQLVDGFSDRAKEFMQLFHRAKKRLVILNESEESQSPALQTFLAAISCSLPSIARAQVEISGKTVSERDEKGGSMIDRTKRLFTSLLFDTLGLDDQSTAKDMEIFTTNIATFQNRLSSSNKIKISQHLQTIKYDTLSEFQKNALERFLLYVDVLQQENVIIKKFLSKNKQLLKEYERISSKLAKNYLEISVNKLRKKFGIKDYGFEVKKYL